jgi:hypothetical protein
MLRVRNVETFAMRLPAVSGSRAEGQMGQPGLTDERVEPFPDEADQSSLTCQEVRTVGNET